MVYRLIGILGLGLALMIQWGETRAGALPHANLAQPVLPPAVDIDTPSATQSTQGSESDGPAAFDPPSSADLVDSPEAPFSPEIIALAEELDHDPRRIFLWVRDHITFTPVWGSVQGGQGCLGTGVGNAHDTASLLVALLRVSGIHARYQQGPIEIPEERARNWLGGFTDVDQAASLLASAGVPDVVRRVDSSGQVRSVVLGHVWVLAYIDYMPSRGAGHVSGDTWIALDPCYKERAYPQAVDWAPHLNLTGETNVLERLAATAIVDVPLGQIQGLDLAYLDQMLQSDMSGALAQVMAEQPDLPLRDSLGLPYTPAAEWRILPANQPYIVHGLPDTFRTIPAADQHRIELAVHREGVEILSIDRTVAELAGHPLILEFEPASMTDSNRLLAAALAGELESVAVGFAQLRPLLLDGETPIALGSALAMGEEVDLAIRFSAPTITTPPVENRITVGERLALAVNAAAVPSSTLEDQATSLHDLIAATEVDRENFDVLRLQRVLLSAMAYSWFSQADQINELAAQQFGVVSLRFPSLAVCQQDWVTAYRLGRPTMARVNGVAMDVDRDLVVTVPKGSDFNRAVLHSLVTGMIGSQLEALIPMLYANALNDAAGQMYMATATSLGMAQEEGGATSLLRRDNIDQVVSHLGLSPSDVADMRNAVANDFWVLVHNDLLIDGTGTGFRGYLILDPRTGSSAYMIGGRAGSLALRCTSYPPDKKMLEKVLGSPWFGLAKDTALTAFDDLRAAANGNDSTVFGRLGQAAAVVDSFLKLKDRLDASKQIVATVGPGAEPLYGLAGFLAGLEVINTLVLPLIASSVSGIAVGAVAGMYLNAVADTAYRGASHMIGRQVEIEAAIQGIQLTPGCVSRQIYGLF